MIFLKKQKISLEELYGYASSDEESTVEEENAPQDAVPVADHVDEVPLCDEVPADESIPAGEGNIMRFFKTRCNISYYDISKK